MFGGYCKKYVKGQRTQGVALEDAWLLKMDEDLDKIEWVKRRKVGYVPNPARSGCTMALWANRNMGVLFGGVTDTEADEESMESTFWNDLYGYQLPGTGRWISLNLRKPKQRSSAKAGGVDGDDAPDPATTLPLTRYNAMLAVQRNTLFMYVTLLMEATVESSKVVTYVPRIDTSASTPWMTFTPLTFPK